jgi:oxygen-dependent protoporphyrinogen oxidase
MADQLLPTDEARRHALVVRGGRLFRVPAGFYLMSPRRLGPLLRSPVLSLRGKLRLLAEPLVARKINKLLGSEGGEQNNCDESVASFVCRRLGRETYERLVQPLVAGIYTADAANLSMAATMPEFLAMEREHGSLLRASLRRPAAVDARSAIRNPRTGIESASGARYASFVAPRDGMSSLVAALAKRLPMGAVRLNAPVESLILREDGRWHVSRAESGTTETFDAVIVALPAYAAARVFRTCDAELAADLAAIPYAGCAVVSCAYRRSQFARPLDGFGFVVPQIERRRLIAGSFASNKFPGRAPHDAALIRAFVGGSLQPDLAGLPDAELVPLVRDELADLLQIVGEPLWADIARWPNSMPQYQLGHLDLVTRIEQRAARLPALALAGNAYRGVGIPQCIASGEAAAARVLSGL